MAGVKGTLKIEAEKIERGAEFEKEAEAAAPFAKPLPELTENRAVVRNDRPLDRFLQIGEQGRETPRQAPPEKPAPAPGIWAKLRQMFSAVPAGFGGPMMIFSFLLFPGRDFARSIASLNEKLREFDEVFNLHQNGVKLSPAQERILNNSKLQGLHQYRLDLIVEYQSRLQQAQRQPQVQLRQEIRRIFDEHNIREPEDVWEHLARSLGVTEEVYMGLLLKTESRAHLESWLKRHAPKEEGGEEETAYKVFVMEWLGEHQVRAGIPMLKEYLRDADPQIRIIAARTLLLFGEPRRVLPTLSKIALQSPSGASRLEAVEAMKELGPKDAAPTLLAVARDGKNPAELRVEAVETLAEWGERGALQPAREVFEEWKFRSLAVETGDNLWEVYHLLRGAKALRQLGHPVDVRAVFQDFLASFKPDEFLQNSKLLEEILEVYAAAEGPQATPLLVDLAFDRSARAELRSGAILALATGGTGKVPERLFHLLQDRQEEEGVRVAALKALVKEPKWAPELAKWALDLVQSKRLFVRVAAIDALIDLGDKQKAVALLGATQKISRSFINQMGLTALEEALPFAYHEYHAVLEMDHWWMYANSRIDPEWENRLSEVEYGALMKMIREEMNQREHFSLPPELEEWLHPQFDWDQIKHAQQDSVFLVGVALSKGILSMSSPGAMPAAQRTELLRGMRQDAVEAVSLVARTELRGIAALLQLHHAGNPHALPALLKLDIRAYLRVPLNDPQALQVLSDLAEVGHRDAQAAFKKGWN